MKYEIISTSFSWFFLWIAHGFRCLASQLMYAQNLLNGSSVLHYVCYTHTLRHMLESHAVVVTSIDWWWIFNAGKTRWRVQCSKVNGRRSRGWQTTEPIHFLYLNLFFSKKSISVAWRECWFDKVNKFSTKITKLFSIYTFSIQEITSMSIRENMWIEKVCWKNVWILKFKISTWHSNVSSWTVERSKIENNNCTWNLLHG